MSWRASSRATGGHSRRSRARSWSCRIAPAPERPREYLKIAPDRLDVATNLVPQQRKRGLFHATVYDAKVAMQGTFAIPDEARLKSLLPKDIRLIWDESFIAVATTSLTGLRSEDRITINGVETPWQPCLEAVGAERDCKGGSIILANAPPATPAGKLPFQLALSLRGTSSFNLMYAGKGARRDHQVAVADAELRGQHPAHQLQRDRAGFRRTLADQQLRLSARLDRRSDRRPGLVEGLGDRRRADRGDATLPHDHPRREVRAAVHRAVVRDLFFFELLARLQIHVVQYGMLALSLSLFSLLLLSLSDRSDTRRDTSSAPGSFSSSRRSIPPPSRRRAVPALVFAGMQASLFAFIYVLLDLETYSLLIGALALFAVVSVLMFLAQRVNWSAQPLAFTR